MKNIIITVVLLISFKAYACDCTSEISTWELRQLSYNNSHKVVMAHVDKVYDDSYQVSIIENFKGSELSNNLTISAKDTCSLIPEESEVWIFYISQEGEVLHVNECFSNRKLSYKSNLDTPPPPEEYDVINGTYKLLCTVSQNEELSWLRSLKGNQNIPKIQDEEPLANKLSDIQFNTLVTLLGLSLVMLLLLLFKIYKRN